MPALYMKSPTARLAYQLKTWQLKQLSVWRQETIGMWNRGHKKKAMVNSVYMTSLLIAAGAGMDVIRDFLQGRPFHLKDFVTDNFWRMWGISRYGVREAGTGDVAKFIGGVFPVAGVIGTPIQDLAYMNDWLKYSKDPIKYKVETGRTRPKDSGMYGISSWRMVPLVGRPLYYGLPYPTIPTSVRELRELALGVPVRINKDTKIKSDVAKRNYFLVEGWRGRKQILRRQKTYYDELIKTKLIAGEDVPELSLYYRTQASMELANIKIQEKMEHGWWKDAMNKIEKAVPFDPYKVPILNVR
jgi:hypothetical protein